MQQMFCCHHANQSGRVGVRSPFNHASQFLGMPYSNSRTAVPSPAGALIYLHLTSPQFTPTFSPKLRPALPQSSSAATSASDTRPPDNLLTARFSATSTQATICAIALPRLGQVSPPFTCFCPLSWGRTPGVYAWSGVVDLGWGRKVTTGKYQHCATRYTIHGACLCNNEHLAGIHKADEAKHDSKAHPSAKAST